MSRNFIAGMSELVGKTQAEDQEVRQKLSELSRRDVEGGVWKGVLTIGRQ